MSKLLKSLGQIAFEAYADATGWQPLEGEPLNGWSGLSEPVRAGWEASALAVSGLAVQAEQVGTLYLLPGCDFLLGRQLYAHLTKLIRMPTCQSFTIQSDGPERPVLVTTTCPVRVPGGAK